MSSLIKEKSGGWRIKFLDGQKTIGIRIGQCDKRTAQATQGFIDRLIDAKRLAAKPDAQTIEWLNRLDATIHDRIANAGLTTPRTQQQAPTLKALIKQFHETLPGKQSTATSYGNTTRNLLEHFGDIPLDQITAQRADEFRVWLDQQVAPATAARRIIACRTIWKKGQRWKIVTDNPFTGVKAGPQTNEARKHFVKPEEACKLMDECPDAQWRLIIALSRFGGVRVPSEILPLKWTDITWPTDSQVGTIRITSPKTEHHAGGGSRIIPLFPEIAQPLMDCFEQAPDGQVFIIQRYQGKSLNWRTQFERIARRAGIKLWPKPFHNMRASRETDLMVEYNFNTVCKWLGNSPTVAAQHYAMSTDINADFRHAATHKTGGPKCGPIVAQNPAQQVPAGNCNELHADHETRENQGNLPHDADGCTYLHAELMGVEGLEPPTLRV